MSIKKPAVDVVCVGFGMTNAIAAQELTEDNLHVVALERGNWRNTSPDFAYPKNTDELKWDTRHKLQMDLSKSTITFRNRPHQKALPMRHLGSFLPGSGAGGSMVHWSGQNWRASPNDLRYRSWLEENYGADFIPDEMTIQDWGVSYEELEPYYAKFELMCGISGKAGNLNGEIQAGGNPFEGPRSGEYPLPPLTQPHSCEVFNDAAKSLGLHPFPGPAAQTSKPYRNIYGVEMQACTYCGFCSHYGCYNNSKASPQACIHPALMPKPNFELRCNAHVTRVLLSEDGKRATGVEYMDADGQLIEQPADIVIIGAFALFNVHLLLKSGIGEPYNYEKQTGVVGRNYAYQALTNATVFFKDKTFNRFVGAGGLGSCVDDYQTTQLEHDKLGFIGGTYLATWQGGAAPIAATPVPDKVKNWGSGWKQAVTQYYDSHLSINSSGSVMSYRSAFLDLDPTYKDEFGEPLLRMTFDFYENEQKMSRYAMQQVKQIAQAMSPEHIDVHQLNVPYDIVPYQSTHNTGGAIMGSDPRTSVVNKYLQVWDVPNVFVPGASAFPQNFAYNPTGTVGALTYFMVDAIRHKYLKEPGPLVSTEEIA